MQRLFKRIVKTQHLGKEYINWQFSFFLKSLRLRILNDFLGINFVSYTYLDRQSDQDAFYSLCLREASNKSPIVGLCAHGCSSGHCGCSIRRLRNCVAIWVAIREGKCLGRIPAASEALPITSGSQVAFAVQIGILLHQKLILSSGSLAHFWS